MKERTYNMNPNDYYTKGIQFTWNHLYWIILKQYFSYTLFSSIEIPERFSIGK